MTPDQLKQRREDMGYTQVEMCTALQMESSAIQTYRNWEQGKARIPPYLVLAIEGIEHRLRAMTR